jgi:hypothetical protein
MLIAWMAVATHLTGASSSLVEDLVSKSLAGVATAAAFLGVTSIARLAGLADLAGLPHEWRRIRFLPVLYAGACVALLVPAAALAQRELLQTVAFGLASGGITGALVGAGVWVFRRDYALGSGYRW